MKIAHPDLARGRQQMMTFFLPELARAIPLMMNHYLFLPMEFVVHHWAKVTA